MDNELCRAIKNEINRVEAQLDEAKAESKHCRQSEQWDIEVQMRSLRIRLDDLNKNMLAANEAYRSTPQVESPIRNVP